MRKLTLLFLLFQILCCSIFAQKQGQALVDSLSDALSKTKQDTNRVNTLVLLSWQLTYTGSYDQALKYANEAMALANSLPSDPKFKKIESDKIPELRSGWVEGKAKVYDCLGAIYFYKGNYPEALKNAYAALDIDALGGDKKKIANDYTHIANNYSVQGDNGPASKNLFAALKIFEDLGDKKGIASTYGSIGTIYYNEGNYAEAIKNQLAGLKGAEESGDKRRAANAYNNLGLSYSAQKNYEDAIKNYSAAQKLYIELGNKLGLSNIYNNLSIVYNDQGKYTEAINSLFASLKIAEEIGDKQGVADNYSNIAVVYQAQEKYKESLQMGLQALKIAEEIGDKRLITATCQVIGAAQLYLKNFTEAKKYLNRSLSLARELGYKEVSMSTYQNMAEMDSMTGNFKSAFNNYKNYIVFKDSSLNEENTKKTVRAQMNYEFDKKQGEEKLEQDKKDALAAEELKRRKQERNYFMAGFALVLLFSLFIFRGYRQKQKANKIISHQKELVEEKNREITDSINYALLIQRAILPGFEEIYKVLPQNFILYKPKDIVAGDFYWMEHVDNMVYIAAADCTGHGVPGAMVSVICNNALNRAVKEFGLRETGQILDKVTELVLETFVRSHASVNDGMDISLLAIHKSNGHVQWSGANNSLCYISNMEWNEIKPDKQPIGKFENRKPFTSHTIECNKGTSFYLFTDGYADQFGGEEGKKFKSKRLKEILLVNSNLNLDEQKIVLEKAFDEWKGRQEQVDDVCVIGLKI